MFYSLTFLLLIGAYFGKLNKKYVEVFFLIIESNTIKYLSKFFGPSIEQFLEENEHPLKQILSVCYN